MKEYIYQICAKEGSSEYGINLMFDKILFAHRPIYKDLEFLTDKVQLAFMYGDSDWMDLNISGVYISF